jgi:hypothetical protein
LDAADFFQPTEDLANSFRTDASGLPYLDDYNSHAVANDQGIASNAPFTLDAGNLDPRLDWTVGRRGIPYLDWGNHPGQNWIREQSSAGPYSPKKNVYFQATKGTLGDSHTWAPGNANQVNIIRFADVLLMAAEAKAQLGTGDLGLSYVNQVRARAAKPASVVYTYKDAANPMGGYTTTPAAKYVVSQYPAGYFTGKALALKAIYFERKLELGMEGHRFFDIVRWGIAQQSLATYFGYDGKTITDVTGAHFTLRALKKSSL